MNCGLKKINFRKNNNNNKPCKTHINKAYIYLYKLSEKDDTHLLIQLSEKDDTSF